MMYQATCFNFSFSFSKDMIVPTGTLKEITWHIANVEEILGFKREKYRDNPWHWRSTMASEEVVSDEIYCEVAGRHNRYIKRLYEKLGEWSKGEIEGETETITVEQSKEFMPGLVSLAIPFERWTDNHSLEVVQEFYDFLQGAPPDGVYVEGHNRFKLTSKQAFSIIWYIQERMRIFPDYFERCSNCGNLYNSYQDGLYWETKYKHYCGCCMHLVPENYDRGKR